MESHIEKSHPDTPIEELILKDVFPFQCDVCHRKFHSITGYNDCKKSHIEDNEDNPCRHPGCKKVYKTKMAEYKHFMTVHNTYDPNDETRKRRKIVHKAKSKYEAHFKCPICPDTFVFLSALKIHVGRDHPDTSWETERSKIDEKPFVCKHCGKRYSRIDQYTDHEKGHDITAKTVKCKDENCKVLFLTEQLMLNHYSNRHGPWAQKNTYKVIQPDGSVDSQIIPKRLLNKANGIDTWAKKHTCKVVKPDGSTSFNFVPKRKHIVEKDKDGNIIVHKKSNSNMLNKCTREISEQKYKPFWDEELEACKVCEKTMKRTSFVKHYNYVHLESQGFMCDLCGAKFTTQNSYKNQTLRKHTDPVHQPKYECKLCGKTFLQKKLRWIHLRNVHKKVIKERCNSCGNEDFARKGRYHKCIEESFGESKNVPIHERTYEEIYVEASELSNTKE